MAWNPFKRFGRKEQPPTPPPPAAPPPPAPAPAEKKPGLLRRMFGRKPKPPAPPTAPPAPPAPPGPPTAPPAGGPEEPSPGASGKYADLVTGPVPSTIYVSIYGHWKISKTVWRGTIRGRLRGHQVKRFIDALADNDEPRAIRILAREYDETGGEFADRINFEQSTWEDFRFEP